MYWDSALDDDDDDDAALDCLMSEQERERERERERESVCVCVCLRVCGEISKQNPEKDAIRVWAVIAGSVEKELEKGRQEKSSSSSSSINQLVFCTCLLLLLQKTLNFCLTTHDAYSCFVLHVFFCKAPPLDQSLVLYPLLPVDQEH